MNWWIDPWNVGSAIWIELVLLEMVGLYFAWIMILLKVLEKLLLHLISSLGKLFLVWYAGLYLKNFQLLFIVNLQYISYCKHDSFSGMKHLHPTAH